MSQVIRNQPNPGLYFQYRGISIYNSIYGLIRHGNTPNTASPERDLLILYHNYILLFNTLDTKKRVNTYEF